jgi:hypothetical protein
MKNLTVYAPFVVLYDLLERKSKSVMIYKAGLHHDEIDALASIASTLTREVFPGLPRWILDDADLHCQTAEQLQAWIDASYNTPGTHISFDLNKISLDQRFCFDYVTERVQTDDLPVQPPRRSKRIKNSNGNSY